MAYGAFRPSVFNASICAALVAILIACATLTWPALDGPFLFDDFPNLQNLAELGGKLDWNSVAAYMSQYRSEPGRPLSMLSFVINDYAWPSNPWGFKYTNLMLHLLIGVVIFGFARSLASMKADRRSSDLTALIVTAAWLLHPIQLSTSMLVVQRMTQLSALFVVAALWSYTSLSQRANNQTTAFAAIAALGTGTVLAVLCKETGALAPLLAILLNVTVLRKRLDELPVHCRRILYWGVLLPVLALIIAIAYRWDALTGYGNRDFSLGERLLTQPRALANYLYQILIPNLRGGGIYHDDFIVSRGLLDPWTTLPAASIVLGFSVSALMLYRRYPMFAFAVLWFFCGHLLESTVFPLELYFEHRNYLPMFGPLFGLALWASTAANRRRRIALFVATLWILFAAWLTGVQAPIWGDARKLTAVWALEHPQSARAIQQRADYLNKYRSGAAAGDLLLEAYQRGVRGTDFPLQTLNIACVENNPAMAERAWPMVSDSLSHGRRDNALLTTITWLRQHTQQNICPEILTEDGWLSLTNTLLANPEYHSGTSNKYLHVERAYLFEHRRRLNATMQELEQAWVARPSPDLAQLIATTLASAGLYDEAEKWAKKALEHRVRGIRGWLSMDDLKSKNLLRALENAEKEHRLQEEQAASLPK